jgi:hypothetical protein
VLALPVGISLGLLGAGGSILTVALLAYALHVEAKVAIATSLPQRASGCRSAAASKIGLNARHGGHQLAQATAGHADWRRGSVMVYCLWTRQDAWSSSSTMGSQPVPRCAPSLGVAAPVGARAACQSLAREVDEVVCLEQPGPFLALSEHYGSSAQTSERAVERRANTMLI